MRVCKKLVTRIVHGLDTVKTSGKKIDKESIRDLFAMINVLSELPENELVFGKYQIEEYQLDSRFNMMCTPRKVTLTSDAFAIDLKNVDLPEDRFNVYAKLVDVKEADNNDIPTLEEVETMNVPRQLVKVREVSPSQFIDLQLNFLGYFKGLRPNFQKVSELVAPVVLSTVTTNTKSFEDDMYMVDLTSPKMPIELTFNPYKSYCYNVTEEDLVDILWAEFIKQFI